MRFHKLFIVALAAVASVGCADAMSDDRQSDDQQSDDGYVTLGETDQQEGMKKADNIDGRKVTWKRNEGHWIEGTTFTGSAEVVSTDPNVQIRTEGIMFEVNDYPVSIDIEANEGRLSTKKMQFVAFRYDYDEEAWKKMDFVKTWTSDECVCRDTYCASLGGAPERCIEQQTHKTRYWRYSEMSIDKEVVEFDDERFHTPLAGRERTDEYKGDTIQIVPIPYGKIGDMEGTYEFELTVECFGGACANQKGS